MKNSKSPSVFVLKLLSQMFQPGMSRGVSKIPEELKEAVISKTSNLNLCIKTILYG